MVANFAHFGNVVILRIMGIFGSCFLHKQVECASRVVCCMFLTIFIFEPM